MFAIITQLQLPQSCRHSNGAGRPSQAAEWQEGVLALWAGRGGGGTSPGCSPTGSLCQLLRPPAPLPGGQGEGALSGHREAGTAQGRLPQTPILLPGPLGRGGAGVRRAGGARGPCGSGLNSGLVLPPGCPWHTPGPLGLTTHSGIPGHSWGRVFMTHSRALLGSWWSHARSSLGQDWLCGEFAVGKALNLGPYLGTPRILPSWHPFPSTL